MSDRSKMIDRMWRQTKIALLFALVMGLIVVTINVASYGMDSAAGRQSLLFLLGFFALGGVIFLFGRWIYRMVRDAR